MKIGLDIMGGDFAPKNCLDGAIMALDSLPSDVTMVLIGDMDKAKSYLKEQGISEDKFEFVHAPDVIEMGEHPTKALAQKPQSSISIGFKLLKARKTEEAHKLFKHTETQYPDSWAVYHGLGETYRQMGQKELALTNYKKSLKINPNNEDSQRAMAKLMAKPAKK